MKGSKVGRISVLILTCFAVCIAIGQKMPLDHTVYDSWKAIRSQTLSRDGSWAMWIQAPQDGDSMGYVRSVSSDTSYELTRPSSQRFTNDGKFVVYLITPPGDEVDQARKDKKKPKDMPRNRLAYVELSSGDVTEIESIQSFRIASEDSGWIVLQPYHFPEETKPAEGEEAEGEEEQEPDKPQHKPNHRTGTPRILLNLATGEERPLEFVTSDTWPESGEYLIYSITHEDPSNDGIYIHSMENGDTSTVMSGIGRYTGVTNHDESGQIAFFTDHEDYESDEPETKAYLWSDGSARKLDLDSGIGEGFEFTTRGGLRFSESGSRLIFRAAPTKPDEPENEEENDEEEVVVDVWHWQDPWLQPMQLLRANAEKNRTFQCVRFLDDRRNIQLEFPELPSVAISDDGDGNVALGTTDVPYRQLISWDQSYNDIYLIDVRSGDRLKIVEQLRGRASQSPSGDYVTWFDPRDENWYCMDTATHRIANLTENFTVALHDELNDRPMMSGSYGSPGWTDGEARLLIYDRFDIWSLDPKGAAAAQSLTMGRGRRWTTRYRLIRLDPDQDTVNLSERQFISAFNETSKQAGFYRFDDGQLTELLMADKRFGALRKAADSDTVLITREDFTEFPNLWVTDLNFGGLRQISDANPQQADYTWGTSELVSWLSNDGIPLQGVLYKPEDFDYTKQYPMLIYFYERLSNNLHRHIVPSPGSSSINISFYVSRGYVVFTPDIPYKLGYPGESAMNAIMPGVQEVLRGGFVDPARMGIQGHSWGGYQVCYMVTRTNMFAAAEGGAPVSNMFSAYGGMRWGSGMSRAFQYERTQSRIGGSIWELPLRYIENSPVFWADKIETPLLMLHNDEDGAVPWYQGIELFNAMRRLQMPVWMFNYNGEGHGLSKRVNRKDWTIRLQQFFDHYLKGDPAPVWLVNGVPATKKGETLGLGYTKGGGG